MTTEAFPTAYVATAPAAQSDQHALVRFGLLRDLRSPRDVFSNLTPNWFASVMGTGIIATAGAGLPYQFHGLRTVATYFWGLAALLLVTFVTLTALHWLYFRSVAASHLRHRVMGHFYGAPAMALMPVGAGTLVVGRDVLGLRLAVDIDWVLWFAGTAFGLITAATVPYLMFTRADLKIEDAFGGWLMPIVPPMVSASTGAMLLPYAPAGQARLTLLMACYAMFGISLLASVITITLIWLRLAVHDEGPARMVPTLWIVLGPLGQSVTAANLLGGNAHLAIPAPYSTAFQAFGVVYGVPVLGFALLWAVVAGTITLRTARAGLPFSLTWWSFTFPIGTCVTGATGLALHTNSAAIRVLAAGLFTVLVCAWLVVAVRTLRAALRGAIFLPA